MADDLRPLETPAAGTSQPAFETPRERLLTCDDLLALSAAGRFGETEKVELIDGRLYVMPSDGPCHIGGNERLGRAFAKLIYADPALEAAWAVIANVTLRISDTRVLQPDFAVLKRAFLAEDRLPGPGDVGLVAEVSDTSLRFDEGGKRTLYAEAGVPEYWVLRPALHGLRVCREPVGGHYLSDPVLARGDTVAPVFAPGASLAVADLLQPETAA